MKQKFLILALGTMLFALPNFLRADEVVIPLVEVVSMTPLPGENPLDGPEQSNPTPPRPTNFHATINVRSLSITKQEASIPSAQAVVVNATTGSVVVNEVFTESMEEQIPDAGVYVIQH